MASVYPLLPAAPIVWMIGTHRLPFPVRALVWPNADVPGEGYADTVYRALAAIGVTATVIPPPAEMKSGWDAADALAVAICHAHHAQTQQRWAAAEAAQ